ncbi:MAG: FmdE family protein [Candidatus Bipolaricaulia bacterium]
MAAEGEGGPLRGRIERLIDAGDLRGLLREAGALHGHLCNYLAYGVVAGYIAVRELGVKTTGMEEVIAIVETNNCFSDGVQMVTGCSFGNNALIYRDLGKTAVTVARRDGAAVRIALDPDFEDALQEEYPEAHRLWTKIVARREEATAEEQERMMRLFAEMSVRELSRPPDEMFRIERMEIAVPEYAPIFSSVRCSICGENVMETRARVRDGKPVCLGCAGGEIHVLDGRGISVERI